MLDTYIVMLHMKSEINRKKYINMTHWHLPDLSNASQTENLAQTHFIISFNVPQILLLQLINFFNNPFAEKKNGQILTSIWVYKLLHLDLPHRCQKSICLYCSICLLSSNPEMHTKLLYGLSPVCSFRQHVITYLYSTEEFHTHETPSLEVSLLIITF